MDNSRLESLDNNVGATDTGVSSLSDAASEWSARLGLHRPRQFHNVVVNIPQGRRIASEYMDAPEFDPSVAHHWASMAEETNRQFDFLTLPKHKGGLGIDVNVTEHDPYKRVRDMISDIRDNNHLSVMSTKTTGGHPFFSNDDNDRFRAVHDAFGHAATGRGFDPHGEEAAFRSHFAMFTPAARPAMATETRGQNSALNYGGPGGGPLSDFAPQKVAVLPSATLITPIGRRAMLLQGLQEARRAHSRAFPR
jgi:hypothetical protein